MSKHQSKASNKQQSLHNKQKPTERTAAEDSKDRAGGKANVVSTVSNVVSTVSNVMAKSPERGATCIALMAVNPYASRPVVRTFPIIPTFGDTGAKHDLAIVLKDTVYQGFRLMTVDGDIWIEPYLN